KTPTSTPPTRTTRAWPAKSLPRNRERTGSAPFVAEPVAHAAHRLEPLALLAELLADRADVDVDVAVDHDRVLSDGARQQLVAREDASGVRHEEVEQADLGRRERDRLAVHEHLVAADVDHEAGELDPLAGGRLRLRLRAAQHGADAREQLARPER